MPKDIAYKSENLPAYKAFANMADKNKESLMVIGATVGGLGGVLSGYSFAINSAQAAALKYGAGELTFLGGVVGLGALGGVMGAFVSKTCYEVFQNKKIKKLSDKTNAI